MPSLKFCFHAGGFQNRLFLKRYYELNKLELNVYFVKLLLSQMLGH